MRTKRVEGYVGRPGAKFLAIRKGGRTFLSRFEPLRLIRKASHDTSDLFPPFLGIILYIQSPPPSSLTLSLFLSSEHTHRGLPRSSSLTRLSPGEITYRYVEVPFDPSAVLSAKRRRGIPRTPDAASRGSCSCRENGDAFINPYRVVYHCVSGHATLENERVTAK